MYVKLSRHSPEAILNFDCFDGCMSCSLSAETKLNINSASQAPGDGDDFTIWMVDAFPSWHLLWHKFMLLLYTKIPSCCKQSFLDWSLKTGCKNNARFLCMLIIKDSWDGNNYCFVEDESETHCCKFFMQMSWKCMLWEPFMLCQLRVDAFLICEVPDFSFEMFCLRWVFIVVHYQLQLYNVAYQHDTYNHNTWVMTTCFDKST